MTTALLVNFAMFGNIGASDLKNAKNLSAEEQTRNKRFFYLMKIED
jgi:hypothetical protein